MDNAVTEFQRRFHISVDDEVQRRDENNPNNSAQVMDTFIIPFFVFFFLFAIYLSLVNCNNNNLIIIN